MKVQILACVAFLALGATACYSPWSDKNEEKYSANLTLADGATFELLAADGTKVALGTGMADLVFTAIVNHESSGTVSSIESYLLLKQNNQDFRFNLPEMETFAGTAAFLNPNQTGQPYPMMFTTTDEQTGTTTSTRTEQCTKQYCSPQNSINDCRGNMTITTTTTTIKRTLTVAWGTVESTPAAFTNVATFDATMTFNKDEESQGSCN